MANDRSSKAGWIAALGAVALVAAGIGAWLVLRGGSDTPTAAGPGYLGVRVHTVDIGAEVLTVSPNTPAAAAGIRAAARAKGRRGDVISAVDGTTIETAPQLVSAIETRHPGDEIQLTIIRGDAITWARLKLVSRPPQSK